MIWFWTKSDRIGSRIIRWGLGEESSHFAVAFFENTDLPVVVESRLDTGVANIHMESFLAKYEIVHAVQMPTTKSEELALYELISKFQGRQYDHWAISYWVFAGLARKLFNCRLPLRNQWGRNEMIYCVEVIQSMPSYLKDIGLDLNEIDLEMTSPEMLYEMVKDYASLRDVTFFFR